MPLGTGAATRRLHTRLLLAVVALIVYGSLFPFHYQAHEPGWADLTRLLQPSPAGLSLSDVVANILLFVPYGLLLASPLLQGRRLPAALAGVALALGVQVLQFWFPHRDPSGMDAVFNGIGLLLGWGAAQLARPWLAGRRLAQLPQPHFVMLSTTLMLLWLLDRWFPWVPTLDVQNLKNGLKPLLLDWRSVGALDVLRHTVAWLVFLRLAGWSLLQRQGMAWLALLCLVVVALKPLFLHNALTAANVLGVMLAVLLGPIFREGAVALLLLVLAQVVVLVLQALAPFEFAWVGGFQWVPFAGSLAADPLAALPPLIDKLYWYGSLVFLLRCLGVPHLACCAAVGSLLLGLEWAQQWVPGRTPEITDPLLACLLAFLVKPVFEGARGAAPPKPPPPARVRAPRRG